LDPTIVTKKDTTLTSRMHFAIPILPFLAAVGSVNGDNDHDEEALQKHLLHANEISFPNRRFDNRGLRKTALRNSKITHNTSTRTPAEIQDEKWSEGSPDLGVIESQSLGRHQSSATSHGVSATDDTNAVDDGYYFYNDVDAVQFSADTGTSDEAIRYESSSSHGWHQYTHGLYLAV